ncbi:hypothetical protein [Robiginitalea aurantiaca]|uniref:STAS/SEC14 domain-containing protein n=1 Tax=Robiginitalea aurantiaca TaxID=3056915 RepID=A0ABT7WAV3_9FLAO|nr:hypothetical protein [Robiginitalea aurantiaca]MDM9630049.1 hypothetical protein [Robiginitalea aurantiaca]
MSSEFLEKTYLTTHELAIGTFNFYEHVIVGQIREGMQISIDNVLPLLALSWEAYQNTSMVYISDRKYSYSLDPTMYYEVKKLIPYMKGYAWVVHNDFNRQVAEIEARFLQCPNAIHSSMSDALKWSLKILEDSSAV